MPLKIIQQSNAITVHIKVVPGASRTRIMGLLGDALKIAISKPPAGGAANKEVMDLLSEFTGSRHVSIIGGQTNPRKLVHIAGITKETFLQQLADAGIEL